jgi:hypothetical protein
VTESLPVAASGSTARSASAVSRERVLHTGACSWWPASLLLLLGLPGLALRRACPDGGAELPLAGCGGVSSAGISEASAGGPAGKGEVPAVGKLDRAVDASFSIEFPSFRGLQHDTGSSNAHVERSLAQVASLLADFARELHFRTDCEVDQ